MIFNGEHAFYAMIDLFSNKIIKYSNIRSGTNVFVDHGSPMDVYMFFREYFGQDNDRYLPMFIHTHPIGASYFSSLDMSTLESFSGLVFPMKMGMQVVTESKILTRIGWMEDVQKFQEKKNIDKEITRAFLFQPLQCEDIITANQHLYDVIREKSYLPEPERESMIRRVFRLRFKKSPDMIASKMKERGVLKNSDY